MQLLFNQDINFVISSKFSEATGFIIYNFQQISCFKINYKEFIITPENLLMIETKMINLKFKGTDFKSNFPLFTSLDLEFIKPPQLCQFQVQPQFGIAFSTEFQLQVMGCVDTKLPLLYKFSLYFNQITYEQDIERGESNSELLLDFQKLSYFNTILPQSKYSHSTLIAKVKNCQGAEFNVTVKVIVGSNIEDIQKKEQSLLLELKQQQLSNKFPRILQESQVRNYQIYNSSLELNDIQRVSLLNILSIKLFENQEAQSNEQNLIKNIFIQLNQDSENELFSQTTKVQIQKSLSRLISLYHISDIDEISDYLKFVENSLIDDIVQNNHITHLIYIDQEVSQNFGLRKLKNNKVINYLTTLDIIFNQQCQIFYDKYNQNVSKLSQNYQLMKENNIQIIKLIKLIVRYALSFLQINGNEIIYNGECFNLIINRVTKDHLIYYTNQIDLTVKKGQNVSQIKSDVVFNFSYINYKKNPFILDESFPQSNLLYTNIQSYEPILPNGSLLIPQQSLPIRFLMNKYRNRLLQQYQDLYLIDQEPNQINYQCTNKYFSKWESDLCNSQPEIDIYGNQIINCNCGHLGPTTVETILADLFQIEKFQKAFSVEALLALLNFPFHRSVIVYSLAIFTLMFILSIPNGFKKDQMDKERQMPIHMIESEYIRKCQCQEEKMIQHKIYQQVEEQQSCKQNQEIEDKSEKNSKNLDLKQIDIENNQQSDNVLSPYLISDQQQNDKNQHIKLEQSEIKIDSRYIEKQETVIQQMLHEKIKQMRENNYHINFSIPNLFEFIILFTQITSVFVYYDDQISRPFRFCLIYKSVIPTFLCCIYFQIKITQMSTITFCIYQWIFTQMGIFFLNILKRSKSYIIKALVVPLQFLSIISIILLFKIQANNFDDLELSNQQGISSIVSVFISFFILDPIWCILIFSIIKLQFNKTNSFLDKLLKWKFVQKKFLLFLNNLEQ